MTIRVLVTGAGNLIGQGIMRALRSMTTPVEVIAADPIHLAAGLYWAKRSHLVQFANDPTYLEVFEKILAEERPQVVLVGTEAEMWLMSENREYLESKYQTNILVSNSRVLAIADDKYLTYEFFKEKGFPCPDSALEDQVEALIQRVGFPLIVKPRQGARSVGVYLVADNDELQKALRDSTEEVVIQEVAGPADAEFTAGVVCFDGKCDASVVMRRDLKDGNTFRAYIEPSTVLNDKIKLMGAALAPYGPANLQFRVNAEGQIKVFEINARFSGTTPLRTLAGFNEVEMCINHLVSGQSITQPVVKEKVFLRHWSETVLDPKDVIPAP
jgi:carbamoyl-phosphate synthase large subunit